MKYIILSLILLASLSGCSKEYLAIDSLADMAPRMMRDDPTKIQYSALVRLRVKGKPHCSGVVIAHNYVLTAGHCVIGLLNKEIVVNPANEITTEITTEIKAKGAGYNMRQDYGVLVGDFSKFRLAKINTRYLDVTHARIIGAFGFPGGQSVFTAVQLNPMYFWMFSLVTSGQVYPGMSGGPVVDVETGEVLGVLSATHELPNGTFGTLVSNLIGLYGAMGIEAVAKD